MRLLCTFKKGRHLPIVGSILLLETLSPVSIKPNINRHRAVSMMFLPLTSCMSSEALALQTAELCCSCSWPVLVDLHCVHSLQMVHLFRQAARNAIDVGFDGVEVHGANVSTCLSSLSYFACRIKLCAAA